MANLSNFTPCLAAALGSTPNLIKLLQSTHGLGVRPQEYSRRKLSSTACLYSSRQSTVKNSMFNFLAISSTSLKSSFSGARHAFFWCSPLGTGKEGSQIIIVAPITRYPCSFRITAVAAESTPPDRPTRTVSFSIKTSQIKIVLKVESQKDTYILVFFGNARKKPSAFAEG